MAGCIMIQGTASSVGKSLMVAGLCRLLRQDGYRVAPFKSQNMSYAVTLDDGSVIASSTIMQAEAAGVKPSRYMNPILLRPTGEKSSEVYVNGRSQGFFSAQEYHRKKPKLMSLVQESYSSLAAQHLSLIHILQPKWRWRSLCATWYRHFRWYAWYPRARKQL